MCLARFGSPATACVDQAEDLSPQSSPFRDAWIGKDVRNKRVSDRVLFPSPAPNTKATPAVAFVFGQGGWVRSHKGSTNRQESRFGRASAASAPGGRGAGCPESFPSPAPSPSPTTSRKSRCFDPAAQSAFACLTSAMQFDPRGDPRSASLIRAVHDWLPA